MESDRVTVAQLKEVFRQLGLTSKGNKQELLKRLFDHDPAGAWKQWVGRIPAEGTSTEMDETVGQQESAEDEAEEGRREATLQDSSRQVVHGGDSTFRDREIEILRRERDIMKRELEILRREREIETDARSMTPPMSSASQISMRLQPKALSELRILRLRKYISGLDRRKQFELIRTTYQLDDGTARILVGMRLKGKALQWFHSSPEHIEMTVDELIERMQGMFDCRPLKMDLRRQFERRTWRGDETFSSYFHDKIILANRVSIDEDELIDYVIDGIPDETTRNQARIHGFRRKEDLLRAFEKVAIRVRSYTRDSDNIIASRTEIRRRTEPQTSFRQTAGQCIADNRCYNCGRTGHTSRNCSRPRREPGSCYECGATDHQIRDCPRRRATTAPRTSAKAETAVQISNIVSEREQSDNEFLETIKLRISRDNLEYSQEFVSQLDTASPISLIKSKFILPNLITENTDNGYIGLNESALRVLGRVEAEIIRGSFSANGMILRVVPDHTMKCDYC